MDQVGLNILLLADGVGAGLLIQALDNELVGPVLKRSDPKALDHPPFEIVAHAKHVNAPKDGCIVNGKIAHPFRGLRV